MPHYKLHRCLICKKFNANMLPEDGKGYLCYRCWYANWKASHKGGTPVVTQPTVKPSEDENVEH
jgi:hypothetical protein